MKNACIRAVSAALGRTLTTPEADGIGERVKNAMRLSARRDLAAFQAMSAPQRLREGAKLAAFQIKQEAKEAAFLDQKAKAIKESIGLAYADWKARGGAVQDFLDRMLRNIADGRGTMQSLESKINAVFADYARKLTTTLEAAHPQIFGLFANKEGARLVTRELYGEDTGDATAKAAAKEWKSVIDSAVDQFKAAGGVLHRLASWAFPQHHDQLKVHDAAGSTHRNAAARAAENMAAWVSFVMPRLDRRKYVSEQGRLMTDDEVAAGMREAWLSISSGGANDIEPGANGGSRMEARRYLDHRAIHFKDADAWLSYQERFGTGDLWHAMTTHLHGMSRSIALLETFGPNPEKQFAFWQDTALVDTAGQSTDSQAQRDKLDRLYRNLSGGNDGVAHAVIAAIADRTKNLLTATRLGSAVIASIPDLGTLWMTARYNRLSGLDAFVNSLKALGGEGKRDLQRAGLMIESTLYSLQRMQSDALGPSFSSRLAEFTMRVQGLNKWTNALRGGHAATQMHAMAEITRGVKSLNDLLPGDAKLLRANGITDVDIQVWAAAKPFDSKAFGEILTPDDIYAIPDAALAGITLPMSHVTRSPIEIKRDAAQKLLGMTITETHMAVVEPGAGERMTTGAQGAKGSGKSVLQGAFWQFKAFPWALFQKHFVQRGGVLSPFGGPQGAFDSAGGKAKYIAGSTIAATLLGALSMEIGDMLLGKDPRPLWGADPKILIRNWAAAFLKGGAVGPYGEFLAAEAAPSPTSAVATLAGPTGGLVHDAIALTAGNAIQAFGGKETNVGPEAVRFGKGILPGSSLWYAKSALDHLIFNQLTDAMNPDHLRRQKERAQKEFGTTYFWPPADVAPARAPDVTAIGGRR